MDTVISSNHYTIFRILLVLGIAALITKKLNKFCIYIEYENSYCVLLMMRVQLNANGICRHCIWKIICAHELLCLCLGRTRAVICYVFLRLILYNTFGTFQNSSSIIWPYASTCTYVAARLYDWLTWMYVRLWLFQKLYITSHSLFGSHSSYSDQGNTVFVLYILQRFYFRKFCGSVKVSTPLMILFI